MKEQKSKKIIAIIMVASVFLSFFTPVSASEESVTSSINGATVSTIAAALGEYLDESGNAGVYHTLPECDQTNINERMLAGIPYADYAAVDAAYQKALEYATQVDLDVYNEVFVEDFSNLDSGWTQTNIIAGAIGN